MNELKLIYQDGVQKPACLFANLPACLDLMTTRDSDEDLIRETSIFACRTLSELHSIFRGSGSIYSLLDKTGNEVAYYVAE